MNALLSISYEQFLKIDDVSRITTLSKTEIHRRVSTGQFPASFKIGRSRRVWLMKDVQAWMARFIPADSANDNIKPTSH